MKNTIVAKLDNMRKLRTWSVLPTSDDQIIIQADGAIGIFNWRSGKGKLCTKGGYFPHLAIARPFTFPAEFVRACLAACPSLGGETVIVPGAAMVNTVEIIR